MSEKENQLVVLEKSNAREVFVKPDGLREILAKINTEALAITPDTSTAKGRAEIASLAFKATKTKTYLEGLGKEIAAELKELPKIVDANRRYVVDTLDTLRDKIRQPLTDWEAEQERIKAEEEAKAAAEKLAAQVEADHELALFMNSEFDRKKAEEAERLKREKEEHDRLIAEKAAQEAKEKAEAEALAKQQEIERQAQADRDAKLRAEIEKEQAIEREKAQKLAAELAAKQAEADRIEREERHKRELEAAKKREELRAQQAAEAERKRIADEKAAEEAAQAKRERDVKHKREVNGKALADLMLQAKLNEDQAKAVIKSIAQGLVSNVSIHY